MIWQKLYDAAIRRGLIMPTSRISDIINDRRLIGQLVKITGRVVGSDICWDPISRRSCAAFTSVDWSDRSTSGGVSRRSQCCLHVEDESGEIGVVGENTFIEDEVSTWVLDSETSPTAAIRTSGKRALVIIRGRCSVERRSDLRRVMNAYGGPGYRNVTVATSRIVETGNTVKVYGCLVSQYATPDPTPVAYNYYVKSTEQFNQTHRPPRPLVPKDYEDWKLSFLRERLRIGPSQKHGDVPVRVVVISKS